MEVVDSEGAFVALEVSSEKNFVCEDGVSISSLDSEWHSIPLEDPCTPEMEYCFHIIEGEQSPREFRKMDLSMCGLSKCFGVEGNDDDESETLVKYPSSLRKECPFVSMETSTGHGGMREVRVSFHGLEDAKKASDDVKYHKVEKVGSESGYRDDGCLPLLQQLRAFMKGAKISFGGFLSGDGKTFIGDGWSSVVDRSVSFKSTASAGSDPACKKSNNGPSLVRSASTAALTSKVPSSGSGVTDTLKSNPLQARDPQSRADALPLAHYRPTDGPCWKDGESKGALSPPSLSPGKSPGTCKKPPKPPKYPGRSASLDSAAAAPQRSVRKLKDRVSSKRKSRAAAAAVSSGVTPLIALVLTLGFGLLMVFQGVFVQSNVAYGKNTDRAFIDTGSNLQTSFSNADGTSHAYPYEIDPHALASVDVDAIRSQAAVSKAFNKSMKELPWSRKLLTSHVNTDSG